MINKSRDVVDVVLPTNLVGILFDPAIPTSSFNLFNCFYTCSQDMALNFNPISLISSWVAHPDSDIILYAGGNNETHYLSIIKI